MERYSEPTQVIPSTFPQMLKPLLRINYIVGTFPYKISFENRLVILSSKSFHYYHCLVTLIIILATVFANFHRSLEVLLSPRPVDSQGKALPIIGRLIELTCTVYANLITMIILLLLFLKRKVLLKYLTEMLHYSDSLKEYTDNAAVYGMVRKLGSLYTCLAIISGLSVAIRYFNNPGDAPVSIWLELIGLHTYVSSDVIAVMSSLFVFYLAVVKYACLGNLEVVSCAQSVCFSRSMENIMEYLEAQMQSWRRQFKGLESQGIIDKDDFLNLFTSPDHHFQNSNKFKLQSDLENYIGQIREFNPGLIAIPPTSLSVEATDSTMDTSSSIKKSFNNPSFKTTPGRALCHAAGKYLSIASMQNMANSVFGNTLAVNIACTVGMNVILKYLVITNLMGHWKRDHAHQKIDLGENETLAFGETDDIASNITSANSTQLQSLSSSFLSFDHLEISQEWLMFLGLDLSIFIRMGVTVICLGRVHKTSLQFNQVMGKAFLTANRIIDEIATATLMRPSSGIGVTGGFNGRDTSNNVEDINRLLMTPTQTSSIIAFINMNNANPVAFTAGGLFVFSRGLILMIVSIIVSYLVFLLQAS